MRFCTYPLVILAGLVVFPQTAKSSGDTECPIYQGKSLSQWLGDLKHSSVERRQGAVKALAVFGPGHRGVLPDLARVLNDTNASVRAEAAETLGKFGRRGREAAPALHRALKKEKQPATSLAIAEALALLGEQPPPEVAGILIGGRHHPRRHR